ncbi:MAG: hypothetical protein ACRCYU_11985 [Nocardioides sp.]
MLPLYSLTAMTGREASASRTVVIGTVELNYRVWIIILCSSPIGLLLAGLCWPLIGQIAILWIFVIPPVALYLVHARSRQGLKQPVYRTLIDKRKADLNTFYLCDEPLKVTVDDFYQIVGNTVPYRRLAAANWTDTT